MMMGPGMMGPRDYGRMCDPRAVGFAEWRIDRFERAIQPTEAQKPKLDELKAAATRPQKRCAPLARPKFEHMVGRMESMEKRLEATLQAVKAMRPALAAFYATLTDEQKARLDNNAGPGRFWQWRWRDRN